MTTCYMSNIPPINIVIISSNTTLSNENLNKFLRKFYSIYLGLIESFNRRIEFREGYDLAVDIEG